MQCISLNKGKVTFGPFRSEEALDSGREPVDDGGQDCVGRQRDCDGGADYHVPLHGEVLESAVEEEAGGGELLDVREHQESDDEGVEYECDGELRRLRPFEAAPRPFLLKLDKDVLWPVSLRIKAQLFKIQ